MRKVLGLMVVAAAFNINTGSGGAQCDGSHANCDANSFFAWTPVACP